jgi:predicted ABC-type ATPase
LAYEFLENVPEKYVYLSADLIASQLFPEHPEKVQFRAGKIFIEQLYEKIEASENLIVESTLSGKSFERFLQQMKAKAYQIKIVFIFLDTPELCVKRVEKRVKAGGHFVPTEDILRRFKRSLRNFWESYRFQGESWHLFYNSAESFEEVAFGEGEKYSVIDEMYFKMFESLREKK